MGKMLSVKAIAEETGLAEYAVRQYVKQGVFPHIRVGDTPKAKILLDIDQVWHALNKMQNTNKTTATITESPDAVKKYDINMFVLYGGTIIKSKKKVPIPREFMTTII